MEVEAMEGKLPYYMVYPMPFIYDDERLDRRDYEYMRSLYPDTAKRVLPYVEEECDRCDGPDSMIYDEYPDQLQLRLMSGRIYDRVSGGARTAGCVRSSIDTKYKTADTCVYSGGVCGPKGRKCPLNMR